MEEKYQPYIVLNGVEYKILVEKPFTYEDIKEFGRSMVSSDNINYIGTDKGILTIPNIKNKDIFFLSKEV